MPEPTAEDRDKAEMLRALANAQFDQYKDSNPKGNRETYYKHGWAAGFDFRQELDSAQGAVNESELGRSAFRGWGTAAYNAKLTSEMVTTLIRICPPHLVDGFREQAERIGKAAAEYAEEALKYKRFSKGFKGEES